MKAQPSTTRPSSPGGRPGRAKDTLSLSIPSTLSAIEPLCTEIRQLLGKRHLEAMRFRVELVARECLNNAILHGNRGQASRRVRFDMRVGRKRISLRIADQGRGFNWRAHKPSWPTASSANGRGLLMASAYAERVAFNRRGNQITLWLSTAREER